MPMVLDYVEYTSVGAVTHARIRITDIVGGATSYRGGVASLLLARGARGWSS